MAGRLGVLIVIVVTDGGDQHASFLQEVHLSHHVSLLSKNLLPEICDCANDCAHLTESLRVYSDEGWRILEGAQVDVLQHIFLQRGWEAREECLVCRDGRRASSRKMFLHSLAHLFRYFVACEVGVDPRELRAVLLEARVESDYHCSEVGIEVDVRKGADQSHHNRDPHLPIFARVGYLHGHDVFMARGGERNEGPVHGAQVARACGCAPFICREPRGVGEVLSSRSRSEVKEIAREPVHEDSREAHHPNETAHAKRHNL
mmetsp:Transcript_27207/g.67482  ORF Transcript_27207/g.67482 Transcript_27207/m.67482 type:complete len:260 (+) Transcript_27207:1831-2610(+)